MSYNTIAQSASDPVLLARITACTAQEGAAEPEVAGYALRWPVCTRADIEAAYASALTAGNDNPGGDEAVISDQMILGAVQAELPGIQQ